MTPSLGPLMTVRTAVILLLALVTGLLAGGMSYLVDHSAPSAVLVGSGAAGSALLLFHSVIEP
ncbi:hypothetical protein [Micromonospora sp. 4G55]|uniref:hypothetical protein n=1 Tax=Micromonospora sp. 4G55 TaxID=2806102 RepID=UPI001A61B75A|nr:hypothetical protein [Micromonospora sp. 4G55]MBM0255534.1 hypothetical protein [Micromonospora sp. 4G55]